MDKKYVADRITELRIKKKCIRIPDEPGPGEEQKLYPEYQFRAFPAIHESVL